MPADESLGPNEDSPAIDEEPALPDASRSLPKVFPPEVLGTLAGPGAQRSPADLQLYGTDLGLTYEHRGRLFVLFGDTWPHDHHTCEADPTNDDTVATLPPSFDGSVPQLSFVTKQDAPSELSMIQLLRGSESLELGFGKVPMAAFSDGDRAFALFARLEPTRCESSESAAPCPGDAGFSCSSTLGQCEPLYTTLKLVCDTEAQLGCFPGQTCAALTPGICVDTDSSQHDETIYGESSAMVQDTEIAVQREDAPEIFDSVFVLPTNRFANATARTVERLTGRSDGNDYRPGHGAVLLWGRPGFAAQDGRQAQLYLLSHPLPLPIEGSGALDFAPRYFAGVDDAGEPTWSEQQSEAEPLALDGVVGGDPHEQMQIVNQTAISWLGPPIDKWVMLYGGDMSNFLLVKPEYARPALAPGAIVVRFADHPWGPWSPPEPLLMPGSPVRQGDPYGPGGFLFHYGCEDLAGAPCARTDPVRPPDSFIPGCPTPDVQLDYGRLYGVNIIDPYTTPNAEGGLDLYWTVSTWNPYAVVLMKTRIGPRREDPVPPRDPADRDALASMSDWRSLPALGQAGTTVQQSSRDRGTDDTTFPLSGNGNRDFNNFLCASADAELGPLQFAPFLFDQLSCEEAYVRGAVLGRFEGSGRLVRTWLGMASLMRGPADAEVFRIYVDDDPVPRVEVPLAAALDGTAGEIFAPPFGAGSPRRLAWYYPVVFQRKLIVALDRLGDLDEYFYQCDVVLDAEPRAPEPVMERLPERDGALRQLSAVDEPVGPLVALGATESISLAAGREQTVHLAGPATIHELRVRVPLEGLPRLGNVRVSVRWDGATQEAIDLPLLELFAASEAAPELPSLALASHVEGSDRILSLRLPMPFDSSAEWTFVNGGLLTARFGLQLLGETAVPTAPFGRLHVQRRETTGPTLAAEHVAVEAGGRGVLVGLCGLFEGRDDPQGGYQSDQLNLLEGDVRIIADGQLALDGTGTEEYADDIFYFADAPQARAFTQAWGRISDASSFPAGRAHFCRWHVLGTEIHFQDSIDVRFEQGGAGNPLVVDRQHTVAFLYLED